MLIRARRSVRCRSLVLTPAISRPSSPSSAVAGIGLADDLAVEHHEDAVGQRADFVELDRDQQDGLAGIAHLDDLVVDELDGADIDAARRLADDQHVGIALHLAGQNDLLLVAAGEIGGLEIDIGRADVELLDMALPPRRAQP